MFIKAIIIKIAITTKMLRMLVYYYFKYYNLLLRADVLPTELFKQKNILIVTAHPDDELFCIAHVLDKIAPVVKETAWVNTTLGQNSIVGDKSYSCLDAGKIRNDEFVSAMRRLSISTYLHLELPSYLNRPFSHIHTDELKALVEKSDFVFLINRDDLHPDHYFTTLTFEGIVPSKKIFYYNVQKIQTSRKYKHYRVDFNQSLFDDLVTNYQSQSHMDLSFSCYNKVFYKQVFISHENFN